MIFVVVVVVPLDMESDSGNATVATEWSAR